MARETVNISISGKTNEYAKQILLKAMNMADIHNIPLEIALKVHEIGAISLNNELLGFINNNLTENHNALMWIANRP